MGTEWLALTGVGIGLIVALIVDRQLLESQSDRPVIAAAITGVVAVIWIALVRLVLWPTPTSVSQRKN
jgi:formate-dependent nitrite reductase membrane component NrfD